MLRARIVSTLVGGLCLRSLTRPSAPNVAPELIDPEGG